MYQPSQELSRVIICEYHIRFDKNHGGKYVELLNKFAIFLRKIFSLAKTMFAHIFYKFTHNQRHVFGTYLHECKPGNGHIRFIFANRVNMKC